MKELEAAAAALAPMNDSLNDAKAKLRDKTLVSSSSRGQEKSKLIARLWMRQISRLQLCERPYEACQGRPESRFLATEAELPLKTVEEGGQHQTTRQRSKTRSARWGLSRESWQSK